MLRSICVALALVALAGTAVPVRAQTAARHAAANAATAPVNLNTATIAQLTTLPGIGPRTAQLIVEYRDKNGAFKRIEELMNVKGIGEKSFLKLKPRITVGSSSAARASGGAQ